MPSPYPKAAWLAAALLGATAAHAAEPPLYVAGLQPDRRPAEAPVVAAAPVDAAIVQQRLRGISKPWPGNVERIAEQGAWFSPMFRPNMTGRYDIRQMHAGQGVRQPQKP